MELIDRVPGGYGRTIAMQSGPAATGAMFDRLAKNWRHPAVDSKAGIGIRDCHN